jgi:AAA family ATP:ADP antiporter
MQSKYLGYITLMVLAYGITINLVEVSWKDSVKLYFSGDKASYNSFMSNLYIYTGISTMVLIVFSQNLLSLFGWRIAASITPIVSLITGGLFFAFLIFKDSMTGICAIIGSTPAAMAMWLGLMQNISTKASKYSLFDPTKEMAYIPLDEESKIKGKAAIDVIGGRAGKSGGGVINMTVGKFFSGHAFTTAIASMTVLICLTWWWAVKKLSVEYDKKIKEKEGA